RLVISGLSVIVLIAVGLGAGVAEARPTPTPPPPPYTPLIPDPGPVDEYGRVHLDDMFGRVCNNAGVRRGGVARQRLLRRAQSRRTGDGCRTWWSDTGGRLDCRTAQRCCRASDCRCVTSWWGDRMSQSGWRRGPRIALGCTDPGVSDAAGIDFRRRMGGSDD